MSTPIASHSAPHNLDQLPLLLDINDIRTLFRVQRAAGYDLVAR